MTRLKVQGMNCQHCVATVTKALEALAGVEQVEVDLAQGEVRYSGEVDPETVKAAITAKGFTLVG
ncbi:heavy-metal-associated domain-containing protein [Desulfogranum mediterraneum]|uniref:heavy-metal-associated domain-containing protein n=1 Tax=Desulfogranum mediterraneum TaxID=160661 RepID=UPI0004144569|nr:heavy metal-associated domain-containing protein [Desulfogranum mediterraneum]